MAGYASSIYYNYDGTVLRLGRGFIGSEGIQYPPNWLEITNDEDKLAIGITIGAAPPTLTFDSRFWFGYDSDGNLIPRQFEDIGPDPVSGVTTTGLRTQFEEEQDRTAYNLLAPNDWYVTRKYERNVDIPVGIASFRSEVIGITTQRQAMILATTDNGQLESLVTGAGTSSIVGYTTTLLPNWPELSDYT